MTRVLVICPDKTGSLMAGTAIRSLEIARALALECDVTLAVPEGSVRVPGALAQVRVPAESTLPPLVAAADCVLVSGRAEIMTAIRKPLVVDLYDPFILSDLEFYGSRFAAAGGRPLLALRWLQHHLAHGDLFLCASEVQRSFWLGMLAAAGRVNRANYEAGHGFEELLAVVPFGIPSLPPARTRAAVKGVIPGIESTDRVILWAGGLWNWFDPLTLLRALRRLRTARPEVKALFLGVRHPNPDIGAMEMADRALALARELDLLDRGAFFVDWVPYDERQNYLLDSDVGVSLHQPGIEAQFAFRTRVLDYLWCGLPMVLSRGDDLALRVERERLGMAVPEGDADAVAAAILRLLDEPDATRSERFAATREELSWARVTEPVRRFCRAPRVAADKAAGAWFAADTDTRTILHKEDALIADEVLGGERELSPPLGRHYAPAQAFVAAYDNLCRVDVLVWVAAPPPPVDVVMSLREDGPEGRCLARVVAPLAALPHDDWHRFEFRPIPNSGGRRYHVRFEVPGVEASGIALWLCRTAAGVEPAPALVMHYLVKGIVEELPIDSEAFLFLHNTTISDTLVPGVGALAAEGDAVAASLLASGAGAGTPLGPGGAGAGVPAAESQAGVPVTEAATGQAVTPGGPAEPTAAETPLEAAAERPLEAGTPGGPRATVTGGGPRMPAMAGGPGEGATEAAPGETAIGGGPGETATTGGPGAAATGAGPGVAAATGRSAATERLAAPPAAAAGGPATARARDALCAELARVAAELAVTRRELTDLAAAQRAGLVEVRVLPRLARELGAAARRALRLAVRVAGVALVGLLVVASLPLALVITAALALTDAWVAVRRQRHRAAPENVTAGEAEHAAAATVTAAGPSAGAATARPSWTESPVSIVIPTWNGCALLEMSLPPLRAALAAHAPGGEIIVVDNGSIDTTRASVAREFPEVRLIVLERNEGFAGATNRGARAALHPILILLNNDMVVEPDFIAPLLRAFDEEPRVFGVSTQIDFIDKAKPRWETGKVHARWKFGAITLFHLDHWDDDLLYPVFFAGGGASAYDREKFLALGGFDEAVFSPVYIEDVDLGYRAWKRGWPSLFQPQSRVHHKHRGTTRRLWSEHRIYSFFVKNLAALVLKNVDDRRLLARQLGGIVILPARVFSQAGAQAALHTFHGMWRQIPAVMRARAREASTPRHLDDATIFRVARYRYAYRSRFGRRPPRPPGARPRVLVVSPYSPYPPIHGGAVRMLALLERLGRACDITLLSYADTPAELDPRSQAELRKHCRAVVVLERETSAVGGVLAPSKTRGFWSAAMVDSLEYLLDREDLDVVQLEYTHLAHLMPPPARGLVRVLVEHDVSFVSLARSRATAAGWTTRLGLWFDWMRMLRYEIAAVEAADLVLTMSDTDRAMLGRFADIGHVVTVPNGVDCRAFAFAPGGRDPDTILFVGFFRHEPNVEAVRYFCHAVLPLVRREVPAVRFQVVGAYPPEIVRRLGAEPGVEITGRVDDVGPYYRASTVFVAPVLQGSGTRLKILEAMASGCPVVSTTIGAEGLDAIGGEHLVLADSAEEMARAVVDLLRNPEQRTLLAERARAMVVERYDWDAIAARLLGAYEDALAGDR